ncbi:ISAs1 family transposase [Streptomyces virginiae]
MRQPASPSTLRRVLVLVCPGGLADPLGRDPAGTQTVAVDGKSARGSRTDATPAAHLLSAVMAAGRVVSQLRVPDKTKEIAAFTALLAPCDLAGTVVTADALRTQREHAKWLVEVKKAHYLLVVKGNQPTLHAAIKALPWKDVTARKLRPRARTRAARDPLGAHAHRHRPRPGLPARGPGGEDPSASHRTEDRQGHPADRLRDHGYAGT